MAAAFAGLAAAQEAGLSPIKLNCVIRKSEDEPDARAPELRERAPSTRPGTRPIEDRAALSGRKAEEGKGEIREFAGG